jgi:hypothetical protein
MEQEDVTTLHLVPRLLAAGLGSTLQAVDALAEFAAETVQATVTRARAVEARVGGTYQGAARRGDALIRRALTDVADRADQVADSAARWADRQIVRRVAESMTPYLVDELIPRVIDGLMPKIEADVVPAVLEDVADDDRIQTMVALQSRNMMARGVAEVRHASADADDRVETAVRRLFRRQDPAV